MDNKPPRSYEELLKKRVRDNHPTDPKDKIKEIIEKIRRIDQDMRDR